MNAFQKSQKDFNFKNQYQQLELNVGQFNVIPIRDEPKLPCLTKLSTQYHK